MNDSDRIGTEIVRRYEAQLPDVDDYKEMDFSELAAAYRTLHKLTRFRVQLSRIPGDATAGALLALHNRHLDAARSALARKMA